VPRSKAVATRDVARVTLVLGADGAQVRGLAPSSGPAGSGSSTAAPAAPADRTHGLGCID
jgi:hypothetical protein